MSRKPFWAALAAATFCAAGTAIAAPFSFDTGNPDGRLASASRPSSTGKFEIESADDFISPAVQITGASFTGLLTGGAAPGSVGQVTVEIYRVFPKDSDVARTSGAPTFSTARVPTRVNSPSDVEFEGRDSAVPGELTFATTLLSPTFSAGNSVQPGGIHPSPGQTTGGDGPVTGQEVRFDVTFTKPFDLPADHYFFVPQVEVAGGEFLWLSSARPIVGGTGPFAPDLQSWTRDQFLDPDWLRIGTDIVGGTPAPTFNASFSLTGTVIPEPAPLALLLGGAAGLAAARRRRASPAS